ncbi:hypothetical protein FRC09_009041 [Ceratobasidium sp. 395]|nr:hypothetical protein FRC09_009041 [Ceratobasidium sp. 395]
MPQVLSPDERAERLKQAGCSIISHILYKDAMEADRDGSNPLATRIDDGFYRIVQHRDDNTVADASLELPSDVAIENALPIQMEVDPGLHTRIWRLTRQYGAEDLFTIAPYRTPTTSSKKPRIGVTTLKKGEAIYAGSSMCYPTWIIESKSATYYTDKDGKLKTIHRFAIAEAGSDQCWQTDGDGKVTLQTLFHSGFRLTSPLQVKPAYLEAGLPPPRQLYELIEAVGEDFVAFSAPKEISVTSPDAVPVKKFYFATSKLGDRELSSFASIQLATDARDQGWASEPHRGLWSWFEIAIFTKLPEHDEKVTPDMIKSGPKGEPLTWLSHKLPLSKEYKEQKGVRFAKDHEIWKFVQSGDYIGVLACAQYALWKAESRNGKLLVQELFVGDAK